VAAGVIIVLLAAVFFLIGDNDDTDVATGTPSVSPSPTQSNASTPSPTTKPKNGNTRQMEKPTAPRGPGNVGNLPAGLFCRDLHAQGFSYVAAVDYWRMHGQPNQMDADRNGIPCETVYPASDVTAYWGGRTVSDLPLTGGLLCRDLYARGFSYAEAVAYWWVDGTPDRMDADRNGIPCETVYPAADVYQFWYG
jgi:hypothetical protein